MVHLSTIKSLIFSHMHFKRCTVVGLDGTGVEKRGGRCDGGIRLSANSEREGRSVPAGMTASV